jgi:hypothetical protein
MQVPTVSRQGAGSIPAGDDSFVLTAHHQRMEMALVKSLHVVILMYWACCLHMKNMLLCYSDYILVKSMCVPQ